MRSEVGGQEGVGLRGGAGAGEMVFAPGATHGPGAREREGELPLRVGTAEFARPDHQGGAVEGGIDAGVTQGFAEKAEFGTEWFKRSAKFAGGEV